MGGYDGIGTYDFLAISRKGKRVKILANPATNKEAWLTLSDNPKFMTLMPLEKWLGEGFDFDVVIQASKPSGEKIEIYSNPDERSKVVSRCQLSTNGGAQSFEGLFTPSRKYGNYANENMDVVRGDWLRVACDSPSCFAKDSLNNPCGDLNSIPDRDGRPDCPRGWIRWRDSNQRLRVFLASAINPCD